MVAAGPERPAAGDLAQPGGPEDTSIESSSSKAKAVTIYVEAYDDDNNLVLEKVDKEVALLSPYMQKQIVTEGQGISEDNPIKPPKGVNLDILKLLMEYCEYHRLNGRSDKERKAHDERYIRMETRRLCELTSAADALEMKPLVDLASKALARLIEGKSPDQIRSTFHLPDDLSEEKLEPIRNLGEDSRIRLLNRLYAKRREAELSKKKGEQEPAAPPPAKPEQKQDTRSVDELLSFIEADEREQAAASAKAAAKPSTGASAKAKRKRNKKRTSCEQQPGEPSMPAAPVPGHGASAGSQQSSPEAAPGAGGQPGSTVHSNLDMSASQDLAEESDYDPDADQEVEELQRRLGTGWEARQQELLSFAHAAASQPRYTTLPSLAAFKQRMAAPPGTPTSDPSPAVLPPLDAPPQHSAEASAQPEPPLSSEPSMDESAAGLSVPAASVSSPPATAAALAAAQLSALSSSVQLPTDKLAAELEHMVAAGGMQQPGHPDVISPSITDQPSAHSSADADAQDDSSQPAADTHTSTPVSDSVAAQHNTDADLHSSMTMPQSDGNPDVSSSAAEDGQSKPADGPALSDLTAAAGQAHTAQHTVAEDAQAGRSGGIFKDAIASKEAKPGLAHVQTPDQPAGDRPSLAKRIIGRFIGAAMGTGSTSSNTSSPKSDDAKGCKGSELHSSQAKLVLEPVDNAGISLEEASSQPAPLSATASGSVPALQSTASSSTPAHMSSSMHKPYDSALPPMAVLRAGNNSAATKAESVSQPAVDATAADQVHASQLNKQPTVSIADAQAAMHLLEGFLQQAGLSQHLRLSFSTDQLVQDAMPGAAAEERGLDSKFTNGHAAMPDQVPPPHADGRPHAAENAIVVSGRLPGGADMHLHLAATPFASS